MTQLDICVMQHRQDPDRPRRALDGMWLCHGHHADLGRLIAEMPAVYDELDRATSPGGARPPGSHSGLVVDDAVSRHRSQIAGVLASWARVVCEERGTRPPARETVPGIAAWLTVHVDWIASQRWCDEMLSELRDLAGKARSLTDIPARRVELGQQCLVHHDGERCDGVVTLLIRGDDWTATCPACRERSKPEPEPRQDATPYLKDLKGWITSDGVQRLARRWGVPCSDEVVRQWKHRGKIVGERRADGTAYDAKTVVEYLTKRTARERMAV